MRTIYLLVTLLCVNITLCDDNDSSNLTVSTKHGKILGETLKSGFKEVLVDVWRSVPYGKPPVGELRFKHPLPVDKWEGVKNVTGIPNSCFQKSSPLVPELQQDDWLGNSVISEDCLYLTVVAPHPRPKDAAVLFWLHGTANSAGSVTQTNYEFKILVAKGNMIIVAPQYRLSAFGFLYSGDAEAPGNAGLMDQLLALKWVQDNINEFGGDPGRVTLSGSNSGAASAGFFLTSPLTSDLFNQAIFHSGAPNMRYGTHGQNFEKSLFYTLAKSLNCHKDNMKTAAITSCLQTKPASEISANTYIGMFQPVPDNSLVFGVESSMLSNILTSSKKKVLIGSTSSEASISLTMMLPDIVKLESLSKMNINSTTFENAVRRLIPYFSPDAQDLIIYNYKSWFDPESTEHNLQALIRLFSDFLTNCELQRFTEFAADANWDVYRYYFDYKLVKRLYLPSPEWTGSFAGVDSAFIQGLPFRDDRNYGIEDKQISSLMMGYISNFVKTGNPNTNEDDKRGLTYWGQYQYKDEHVRYFNFTNSFMGFTRNGRYNKDCVVWNKFIPMIQKYQGLSDTTCTHSKTTTNFSNVWTTFLLMMSMSVLWMRTQF